MGASGDKKFSDQNRHSIHTSIHIPQLTIQHHRHRGFCCVETPGEGWWEYQVTGSSLTTITSIHIPRFAVLRHRRRGFCCVETPDDGWWEHPETGGSPTLSASSSKQSRWASTFWSMMCSFHHHLLWTVTQNWTPPSAESWLKLSEQALACNSSTS